MSDQPIGGSLFHDDVVRYVVGALCLGKPPIKGTEPPHSKAGKRSALSSLVVGCFPERLYHHGTKLAARLLHAYDTEGGLKRSLETTQGIPVERVAD